jgi:hypothetical protein
MLIFFAILFALLVGLGHLVCGSVVGSISRIPFGTRRKGFRFGRSRTLGSRVSRSQKSRMNSNSRLRAYDARQHALAPRSLRHRGVRQLRTLDRRQRRPAAETLFVPEVGKRLRCSSCGGKRYRRAPLGTRAHGRAFLTIGVNGRRCPRLRRRHRPASFRRGPGRPRPPPSAPPPSQR